MCSDIDNSNLSLIGTDKDGVWHFRLVSPTGQVDFDAIQNTDAILEWVVIRIIYRSVITGGKKTLPAQESRNSEVLSSIQQALNDFGHFFGDNAGRVRVTIQGTVVYK